MCTHSSNRSSQTDDFSVGEVLLVAADVLLNAPLLDGYVLKSIRECVIVHSLAHFDDVHATHSHRPHIKNAILPTLHYVPLTDGRRQSPLALVWLT